jgi:hypothetical protein
VATLTGGDWALLVAALGCSAVAGIGIFQALFVMPEYFDEPPASLARYQHDQSWKMWLPLHLVTLAALITGTVLTWSESRRAIVLAADVLYLTVWLTTLLFFIPGVIRFNKVDPTGPPSPELRQEAQTWLRRSSIRHVLTLATAIAVLIALAG